MTYIRIHQVIDLQAIEIFIWPLRPYLTFEVKDNILEKVAQYMDEN